MQTNLTKSLDISDEEGDKKTGFSRQENLYYILATYIGLSILDVSHHQISFNEI
jgi:hypothetical protein